MTSETAMRGCWKPSVIRMEPVEPWEVHVSPMVQDKVRLSMDFEPFWLLNTCWAEALLCASNEPKVMRVEVRKRWFIWAELHCHPQNLHVQGLQCGISWRMRQELFKLREKSALTVREVQVKGYNSTSVKVVNFRSVLRFLWAPLDGWLRSSSGIEKAKV